MAGVSDDADGGVRADRVAHAPVLVVGTDDWAVEQARDRLADAGLVAFTCHTPGQPAFPCDALQAGKLCPLDRGCGVVVTVRARPLERPAPGEMGVVCALHRGVALVGAGMPGDNPFGPWLSRWVPADEDIATVVAGLVGGGVEP
jgi:hypothetical protein